jgi:predicted TIM-barrel fold metal-dependent hydrolase
MRRVLLTALGIALFAIGVVAQEPDAKLMEYIDSIKAVDNHAHVVAPDMEHDTGYDALRCETLPASTVLAPANARFGPSIQAAWKTLYGVTVESDSAESLKLVSAGQKAVRDREGAGYFDWVLAQAGFDVVLANRVSMAPQLDAKHFKWVPYDDALLFPLSNATLKAASPDRKVLFEAEEGLLQSYETAAALKLKPVSLDLYLTNVIDKTLKVQKDGGAAAIKFEVAYLRSLDFEPAARDAAAAVYKRYAGSTKGPSAAEYKLLQDFLFRYVAQKAGELGLAIHIHTGAGCGEYFDDRGSDPMLLDSVLNDSSLRKTNFVLLHGGSPFDRHNVALIMKPNVWVDTSVLGLLYSPAELARIMRPWLEMMPEHVIFGTDAGPFGPGYGWEETAWVASRNARRGLGIVLTQMIRDGVITEPRAREIAELVLRKNAAQLYGLK